MKLHVGSPNASEEATQQKYGLRTLKMYGQNSSQLALTL